MAYVFIILGVLFRLVPHMPNATPIAAIALFGGVYLSKKQALWVPLLIMAVSDLFIGMHPLVLFTWGSILLTSMIGIWLRDHKSTFNTIGSSLLSSIIFFIVTNFGVWAMPQSWYPHTVSGLLSCYALAIPFFRATVTGDLLYVGVLFGLYELSKATVRKLAYSNK